MRRHQLSDIHLSRGNRSKQILSPMIILSSGMFFPEAVPCELPKDKGTRHEVDLKPGVKYCVMKECPVNKY